MNKIVNKHQAVCGVVWIVILFIIILRPLRFVTLKPVVSSNQQISMVSEEIRGDCLAAQRFIAPYSHLKDIKIYLLNETTGGEFRFILFDADYNAILDRNVTIDDTEEIPGLYTIRLKQDLESGKEYCYMIQGVSEDIYVAYEDTASSGTSCNGTLFYNGREIKGHNIITEYDYEIPFGSGKAFACYAAAVLTGLLISFLSKWHYEKHPEKNCLLTVEMVWKRVASPVVIAAAIVSMVAIWPCNLFSNEGYAYVLFGFSDIIFFETGILITAGILLYGINHKRDHKSNDMGLSILRDRWTDYAQAVFFALAIQATVHYMNGLYENHHMIAYREMLIYLGLAVIMTYKRKEIFNRVNMIYLVIAAVCGFLYYNSQAILVNNDDEVKILKLTIWAAVITGIVIINTISILVRRQVGKISGYGIIVAAFFALLVIFRNTRGWTIYLVCAFSLYYLRIAAWDKKERLLQNICNGILLNFLMMAGYCLLHRPYLYRITRYSFAFHTVTISAEYLSLVVTAAFVKLIQAYRRGPKLSYIWKELTIFGISTVYLILTLSRTGYLAVIVMLLVMVPFVCIGFRHKLKAMFILAAMLTAAVITCFSPVFTLQRIVPAVAAQPEKFEIEWIPKDIEEERNMDSWYYITVRRFVQMFEMKILNIPEEKCVKPYRIINHEENEKIFTEEPAGGLGSGSAEDVAEEQENEELQVSDESFIESYSTGRMEIFKMYMSNLNMTGYDTMQVVMPDGTLEGSHAHNTYIQAAHDHGIPVGIIFIIFILSAMIQAVVYYKRRKEDRTCSLLPFALLITFAAAGMTEWIFHPCNPLALGMLLILAPLLCDMRGGTYHTADDV